MCLMAKPVKTAGVPLRNPERTRERILSAALEGVRRERFCRSAGGCHCAARGHQQTDALPLLRQQGTFVPRSAAPENVPAAGLAETLSGDPAESLAFWFEAACKDTDWVRLLEWEALQEADKRLIDEKNRRAATARGLERIRQRQARGQISAELDPRHVMLAMRSLTMFPAAFPQLTRLIMGRPVSDPRVPEGTRGVSEKICLGLSTIRDAEFRSKSILPGKQQA